MAEKKFVYSSINDYKRLAVVAFFLFFLFCLLIIQYYKVQIMEGDKWTKQALCQHRFTEKEPFMRGRFFSNNTILSDYLEEGQPFVIDVPKFHLYIDPKALPKEYKPKIAKAIIEFFNLSEKEIESVKASFYRRSRSRKLVSWIDKDKKQRLEKWWRSFIRKKGIPRNAMYFILDYKRSYPYGTMLGQVLHTIQDQKDADFQGIPTGGLELYFNKYLKGKIGIKESYRSLRNTLDTLRVIQYPQNGADIYLTINQYIQAIVDEELEKGVRKVNAKGGWAIMMDPSNGEILALSQYPFFDLKNYSKYFNDKSLQEHTQTKAISYAFEPASIFKPITLAICLKANEIRENTCGSITNKKNASRGPLFFDPMEKIPTHDGYFPGRITPIKDGRRHNFLNMYMAIQKSSNVYMGQVVKRVISEMGDVWYKKALEEMFCFGKKTGVELPGESTGLVPTPGKLHPNGSLEWSLSTPYSLAIGHNILVNSLQIAKAYAVIANFGIDVEPTLLRKIVLKDENKKDVILFDNESFKKKQKAKRVLSKENAAQIINAMKFTTKLGGTARFADIPGYTEAGKTGTSGKIINGKYSDQYYISSFVGFAPARNAKFVLMIVIDEPEKKYIQGRGKSWHGGICAAPIFREIAMRTLEYLGVEPDDPYGYPYGDKRRNAKKADWVDEISQMNNLYKYWNQ